MSRDRDAFAALADPTRRRILELLRDERSLAAGDIAQRFPKISRVAVSKHLRVLREAKLVRSRKAGRERHYTLDPKPLATIYREWLERFAPVMEASLAELKRRVEREPEREP